MAQGQRFPGGQDWCLFWFISSLSLKDLYWFSTEKWKLVTAGLQRLTWTEAEMSEPTVACCHWRMETPTIGTKPSYHNIPCSDTAASMASQCFLPQLLVQREGHNLSGEAVWEGVFFNNNGNENSISWCCKGPACVHILSTQCRVVGSAFPQQENPQYMVWPLQMHSQSSSYKGPPQCHTVVIGLPKNWLGIKVVQAT